MAVRNVPDQYRTFKLLLAWSGYLYHYKHKKENTDFIQFQIIQLGKEEIESKLEGDIWKDTDMLSRTCFAYLVSFLFVGFSIMIKLGINSLVHLQNPLKSPQLFY